VQLVSLMESILIGRLVALQATGYWFKSNLFQALQHLYQITRLTDSQIVQYQFGT
jgi:hypothetical protein